jgi:sporulation protein YlmC with PRC-barrel domain
MCASIYTSGGEQKPRDAQTNRPADVAQAYDTYSILAHDLNGKAIINIQNGEKVGSVADLLFDPAQLRVAAVAITPNNSGGLGNLFRRDTDTLPANLIKVWGKDAILVDGMNTINEIQHPESNQWVRLANQIRGRYVVSTDGERVGQIDDVRLDNTGRIVGVTLNQVYIDGPLNQSRLIPIQAISSLGKDVLIVNLSQL